MRAPMQALTDTTPHPAAAALRVEYRLQPLDALLADPQLLAVFGFGDAAPSGHADPRYLQVALPAAGGTAGVAGLPLAGVPGLPGGGASSSGAVRGLQLPGQAALPDAQAFAVDALADGGNRIRVRLQPAPRRNCRW